MLFLSILLHKVTGKGNVENIPQITNAKLSINNNKIQIEPRLQNVFKLKTVLKNAVAILNSHVIERVGIRNAVVKINKKDECFTTIIVI